jgi:hypothetical protein
MHNSMHDYLVSKYHNNMHDTLFYKFQHSESLYIHIMEQIGTVQGSTGFSFYRQICKAVYLCICCIKVCSIYCQSLLFPCSYVCLINIHIIAYMGNKIIHLLSFFLKWTVVIGSRDACCQWCCLCADCTCVLSIILCWGQCIGCTNDSMGTWRTYLQTVHTYHEGKYIQMKCIQADQGGGIRLHVWQGNMSHAQQQSSTQIHGHCPFIANLYLWYPAAGVSSGYITWKCSL